MFSTPDEKFQLWATQALNGQTTLLTSDYSAVDGSNLLSVNIDSLTPGSYTITLLGDSHLYQCHFVKF